MEGLLAPHPSPIHRAPARLKLALSAAAGVGLFLVDSPLVLAITALGTLLLLACARVSPRDLVPHVRGIVTLLVLLLVVHWASGNWQVGLVVVLRFLIVAIVAALVTLTTPASELMDAMEAALRPLALVGVRPAKVALMLSMTIRLVPLLAAQLRELRDAQRSRGCERGTLSLVVPLTIRALRMSDDIADALEARGYDAD